MLLDGLPYTVIFMWVSRHLIAQPFSVQYSDKFSQPNFKHRQKSDFHNFKIHLVGSDHTLSQNSTEISTFSLQCVENSKQSRFEVRVKIYFSFFLSFSAGVKAKPKPYSHRLQNQCLTMLWRLITMCVLIYLKQRHELLFKNMQKY